jgi:D-glycero-D-manno-heptose 1,7-bisphosphate phosphatase
MAERRPAVFLDRDGTLLEECDYLADPERVRFLPGAVDALRRLRRGGYALVLVTNQSGIARGLYADADYHAVQARLTTLLSEEGVPLDATYHCPHHPDFTGPCDCRKPGLGMYRAAERDLEVATARSWYVGDKVTDVLPAIRLGGRGVLVRTGYGRQNEPRKPPEVAVADDLAAAADLILGPRLSQDGAGGVAPLVDPPSRPE